jgi:hypothetical protein
MEKLLVTRREVDHHPSTCIDEIAMCACGTTAVSSLFRGNRELLTNCFRQKKFETDDRTTNTRTHDTCRSERRTSARYHRLNNNHSTDVSFVVKVTSERKRKNNIGKRENITKRSCVPDAVAIVATSANDTHVTTRNDESACIWSNRSNNTVTNDDGGSPGDV